MGNFKVWKPQKKKKQTLFDQVKNLGDIDFVTLQIEFLSAEGKKLHI